MSNDGLVTEWHKAVKIQMIMKDITYSDIMNDLNISRVYLSQIMNGHVYSKSTMKELSDYLGVPDGDFTISVKYIPKLR